MLDGHTPVPEPDILKWGAWYETADRHVAKDTIGDAVVSTVFLGLDHAFCGGPPVLYETMVFGGDLDQSQERYHTWAEAEAGHRRWVELVSAGPTAVAGAGA